MKFTIVVEVSNVEHDDVEVILTWLAGRVNDIKDVAVESIEVVS